MEVSPDSSCVGSKTGECSACLMPTKGMCALSRGVSGCESGLDQLIYGNVAGGFFSLPSHSLLAG